MAKGRKMTDALARTNTTANYLRQLRAWKNKGMRGPRPKPPGKKKSVAVKDLF